MQYRNFGRLKWKVSALGFGAMRLPIINGDSSRINEDEAIYMIRYAIDNGVNYIDTAYPYHGGKGEVVVGKALEDGYRERVKLATKMPTWLVNSQSDMDKYLEEQLLRLKTERVDFYLLHGLNKERWKKMGELNVFGWAEKAISNGKINYLGFSFHDDFDTFKDIVDGYDKWTFCQILYNYMDTEYQAGTRGLKYAASRGLAVVVMEPLAGGILAFPSSKEVQEIWDSSGVKRTPAEWGLQWVWNHPEVSVVLSGMSTLEQVKENIESACRSGVNILSEEELETIKRVREKIRQYGYIGCGGCRYCMPCPQGVGIPEIFALYNEYNRVHGNATRTAEVREQYRRTIIPEKSARRCANCGQCENKCPQQLPIRKLLGKAAIVFESSR